MRTSAIVAALRITFFAAVGLAIATPGFAVDCCSFNGSPCNYFGTPGLVHGVAPWTGNVCGVTIEGTDCHARLDTTDGSVASGDCITLGKGVTLDLNGRTITCSGTNCGGGVVNASSSGAADKVVIKNGKITGCWQRGVIFSGGTNSSVEDLTVDLTATGAACNYGGILNAGIFTPRGLISRSVVSNAFVGIYAQPGENVTDSLVTECYVGIDNVGASSASVTLTNLQLLANGYNVKNRNPGVYRPHVVNVSLQDPAGCHCLNASNACVSDINDCLDFGTSPGNASFVDKTILP